MKKLILGLALLFATSLVFGQSDTTIYTTLKTENISGSEGSGTCTHEWFPTTTNTDVKDTVAVNDSLSIIEVKTQTFSRQCTKCGKQTATINTWTNYMTYPNPHTDAGDVGTLYGDKLPILNEKGEIQNPNKFSIKLNSVNTSVAYIKE